MNFSLFNRAMILGLNPGFCPILISVFTKLIIVKSGSKEKRENESKSPVTSRGEQRPLEPTLGGRRSDRRQATPEVQVQESPLVVHGPQGRK